MVRARKHLIVTLSGPSRASILALAQEIRDHVSMVRVQMGTFLTHGPGLLQDLRDRGLDIFLDLKLHDTVEEITAAVKQARKMGIQLFSLHGLNNKDTFAAAHKAAMRTGIIAYIPTASPNEDASGSAIDLSELIADGISLDTKTLDQAILNSKQVIICDDRPCAMERIESVVTRMQETIEAGATWFAFTPAINDPLKTPGDLCKRFVNALGKE